MTLSCISYPLIGCLALERRARFLGHILSSASKPCPFAVERDKPGLYLLGFLGFAFRNVGLAHIAENPVRPFLFC